MFWRRYKIYKASGRASLAYGRYDIATLVGPGWTFETRAKALVFVLTPCLVGDSGVSEREFEGLDVDVRTG